MPFLMLLLELSFRCSSSNRTCRRIDPEPGSDDKNGEEGMNGEDLATVEWGGGARERKESTIIGV